MGEEIKQGLTLQSTAHEKPRTGLPLYRNILFDIFSTAKVQQNSETTKDLAKKNCLLLHHSALIAGASARQLKQSWHRVPSIRKINQLSCQAGSKWWKVIQAFRLQRYEEKSTISLFYTFFID